MISTTKTTAILLALLSAFALARQASAATDASKAIVRHRPPLEAAAGKDLRLVAVIDNDWSEGGVLVHYRPVGADKFLRTPFERSSAGGYFATIPKQVVARPGLEYFIAGASGGRVHFGTAKAPHVVRVVRDLGSAWREGELHRLGGRRYSMSLELDFQSFGSNSGPDRYASGEVDWSYRLVSRLYSISLGFGFLEADAPTSPLPDADNEQRGYRYGYGGVRIRARKSVWFDGRASLGFGDNGFSPGVGGQVIFGDDWRSCVKLGADYSSALSYRAWATLQWDTVPGVLMSATATTTNQPRSEIDSGSTVVYRLMVPVGEQLVLTGKLSYGGRGNRPGGVGGGLATELRF